MRLLIITLLYICCLTKQAQAKDYEIAEEVYLSEKFFHPGLGNIRLSAAKTKYPNHNTEYIAFFLMEFDDIIKALPQIWWSAENFVKITNFKLIDLNKDQQHDLVISAAFRTGRNLDEFQDQIVIYYGNGTQFIRNFKIEQKFLINMAKIMNHVSPPYKPGEKLAYTPVRMDYILLAHKHALRELNKDK